jgi:hypothetical protein
MAATVFENDDYKRVADASFDNFMGSMDRGYPISMKNDMIREMVVHAFKTGFTEGANTGSVVTAEIIARALRDLTGIDLEQI